MKWKPIIHIFFLFSLIIALFRPALYAGTDSASYALAHYSNENGLPQNSVKAIVPDEYGFIWLATESGLVRFDGRNFKLFNRYNTGIVSSRIIDIWRSPNGGSLHAITQNWTLLGIKQGKVYTENKKWLDVSSPILPQSWKYEGWTDPYHLDSLRLYLPHDTSLLVTLDGNIRWYHKRKIFGTIHVPFLHKFQKIFTLGSSVYILPEQNKANQSIFQVDKDRIKEVRVTGDLLQQSRCGEWILGLNNPVKQVFLYCNKQLYQLQQHADGSLYTTLLLSGYDFEKLKINCCYYDTLRKRLFLGSSVHGLFVLSAKPFRVSAFSEAGGRNSFVFYDHVPYSDTSVLTAKGILLYTDHPGYKFFPEVKRRSRGVDEILFKSRDSTLWTADYDYVYQLSKEGTKVLHRWQVNSVCAFTQLASGEIWAGTYGQGIYAILPDRPELPARHILKMTERVICMEQETAAILWLATNSRLLRCTLPGMKMDTIKALDYQMVRNIYIPRQNEIWFCTYEAGFYLYRDEQLIRFPPDRNRHLNTVHHIAEDRQGFFWVSTNNGIFKMAKQDLLAYASDNAKIPFYLYYTRESGFNTNEFNGSNQQVGAKLANGSLSFASVDGIVFLKPDSFPTQLPDAPLIIDKIEVDGNPVAVSDMIRLDHSFSDIRFRIATPYFGNPDNLMFEYRLDNNDWLPVENELLAFNALKAGKHLLTIRKRAGFNGRYRYKSITVAVAPAFWETWWFRTIVILLLIGAIWLLVRLRIFFLNRKNKMLEHVIAKRTAELYNIITELEVSEMKLAEELKLQQRLIGNIAHDIKTPLKYLTLSAKHLSNKVKQQKMPEYAEAESLHTSSAKIYAFTDNLMVYLKARLESEVVKKELDLREVVEHQREIFDIALQTQGNVLLNEVPQGLMLKTHRQLLSIVLHNLTDNAVKNTKNGVITFTAKAHGNCISVYLEDTGRGLGSQGTGRYNDYFSNMDLQEKETHTGFGFLIIKDILPLIDASLTFEHTGGTKVTLTICSPEPGDQEPEPE